nr:hypothetical protein [Tanacetum cinerariifolium]
MSADFAVTYTSVHSKVRSWSIPSEDPYEEAAQQLLEQAPCSPEYVPNPIEMEDHVPAHIPEHPEDLVQAEDEAPIEAYILEVASAPTSPLLPSFLSPRTPPLLPIPLPVPSTSRRAEIPEADTPPQKRLLLTGPRPGCEVGESSTAEDDDRLRDGQHEGQLPVLETQARRNEWQRQTADDFAVQHIMRTQALEAGARIDTLKDTGVAAAMAEAEASRVRNGYDSNGSGPMLAQAVRECTYLDFLKCQPLNFKGTEGVVRLTQCRRFQELALMCDRMFPEESDRIEKYIGGLPDMIHDS